MSRYKTPLRYPGGKQKLAPFIAEIIDANNLTGGDYAEPYAGGAGVAMELLLAGKVDRVHLNDSSRAVYCFWYSILNYTKKFCRRIENAKMTIDEWRHQREILRHPAGFSALDLGFSLFYLNRCNRSGIPSGGVIGGLQQIGNWKMNARFPRKELISRIKTIAQKKDSIRLKNWDAERFIHEYLPKLPQQSLVYCDPPYFQQGHRLYLSRYNTADHKRLSQVIQKQLHLPWIVSYDGAPEVLRLYDNRRWFLYDLQYNAQRVHKGKEVFVFSDSLQLPDTSRVKAINDAIHAAAA